jgi:hypothetical protein
MIGTNQDAFLGTRCGKRATDLGVKFAQFLKDLAQHPGLPQTARAKLAWGVAGDEATKLEFIDSVLAP